MKGHHLAAVALICGAVAATAGQRLSGVEPLTWQPSSVPPFSGLMRAVVETPSGALIAAASRPGLYRSSDDGRTWQACAPVPNFRDMGVGPTPAVAAAGGEVYVSGYGNHSVHVTDHQCRTYDVRLLPAAPAFQGGSIVLAVTTRGVLIAAWRGGVAASSDGGRTWTHSAVAMEGDPRVTVTRRGTLLLSDTLRLYRSVDQGASWTATPPPGRIGGIIQGTTSLIASGFSQAWRSVDDGLTWTPAFETALTLHAGPGNRLYSTSYTSAEIGLSVDDGRRWTAIANPGRKLFVSALLETRLGSLLAATLHGMFRTQDDGRTWHHVGVHAENVKTIAAEPGRAVALGDQGAIWSSADAGNTWDRLPNAGVRYEGDVIYSSAFLSGIFFPGNRRILGLTTGALLASDDEGITWAVSGLRKGAQSIVRVGGTWFAGGSNGIFKSDDLTRWTECSAGLPNTSVASLAVTTQGDLLALTSSDVYRSTDQCQSWWLLAEPPRAISPWRFFMSGSEGGTVAFGNGIAQLSMVDHKWIVKAARPAITAVTRDARGRYWVGTREGVFLLSIHDGPWELGPAGLAGQPVSALTFEPSGYLLAAVSGHGTLRARLP